MNGYGEFSWKDGKKYCGFYKNDKKSGFGIYYLTNNKFYVGFWLDGKQNGVGKFFNDNYIKYGKWKEGQKETEMFSEEDFINCFNSFESNYIKIFHWNKEKLKNFMKIKLNTL